MDKSILIFGGGALQISLIKRVKLKGFKAIVIDPNPEAVGKSVADSFFEVAGNDFEKTLNIAKSNNIIGLVTAATDHPILMMCRIATELNLAFPSYQSCETLLNKGKFKLFLNENNIVYAKGAVYKKEDIINLVNIKFPVIIKPLNNSGSRGVIKCSHIENLKNCVEECLLYCKDGRFIMEEFIDGDEISVEAIVYGGLVQIIQITDKIVSEPPYNVELGHIQPSKYLHRENEIKDILQEIVSLTGFDNSAIHPEFKINSMGEIYIIEIGTRLGGDYITSDLTTLSTGVDIEELQILIATKQKISYKKIDHCSTILFLNFPEGTVIQNDIDRTKILELYPNITRFVSSLKPKDKIDKITNSLERYGYVIIQSSCLRELKISRAEINDFLHFKYSDNG